MDALYQLCRLVSRKRKNNINARHSTGSQLGMPNQNVGLGFAELIYQKPIRFQREFVSSDLLTGFNKTEAGSNFSSVLDGSIAFQTLP